MLFLGLVAGGAALWFYQLSRITQNAETSVRLEITSREATEGTVKVVTIPGTHERVNVAVPAGVADGARLPMRFRPHNAIEPGWVAVIIHIRD